MKDIDYDAILAGKIKQEGMDDDTFREFMGYNEKHINSEIVAGIFLCLAIICGCIFFYTLNVMICKEKATQMGFECSYSVIAGCQIKLDNGHYMPIDNYRGN